mmetsp:Transcript_5741/g.10249  ORF Transcript_5741/g.10249 Transcript_5741/m.10249 type:complete len:250 (-) Transcript_5741:189-938(-)
MKHKEAVEELQNQVRSLTERESNLLMENSRLRSKKRSMDFEVRLREEAKVHAEVSVQEFAEASVQYSISEDVMTPVTVPLNLISIMMSSVNRMKLSTQVIRLTSKGKEHLRTIRIEFSEAAVHALENIKTVEDVLEVKAAFASSTLAWNTKSFFKKSSNCSVALDAISSIAWKKESAIFARARPTDLPSLSIYYAANGQQKCLDLLFQDFALYKIWTVGLEMLLYAAKGVKLEEETLQQLRQYHIDSPK